MLLLKDLENAAECYTEKKIREFSFTKFQKKKKILLPSFLKKNIYERKKISVYYYYYNYIFLYLEYSLQR